MRTHAISPVDGRFIAARASGAREGVRTRCTHMLRQDAS